MHNPLFVKIMIGLLTLAYMFALAISTAHLAQVYHLFAGGLPYSISLGLAAALEVVAFLFSIITTSLKDKAGPWAAWASTSALLLVWFGNGYAMYLAAPTQHLLVTTLFSCFVPISTLFVGKVLGQMFSLLEEFARDDQREANRLQQAEAELLQVRQELQDSRRAQATRPLPVSSSPVESPTRALQQRTPEAQRTLQRWPEYEPRAGGIPPVAVRHAQDVPLTSQLATQANPATPATPAPASSAMNAGDTLASPAAAPTQPEALGIPNSAAELGEIEWSNLGSQPSASPTIANGGVDATTREPGETPAPLAQAEGEIATTLNTSAQSSTSQEETSALIPASRVDSDMPTITTIAPQLSPELGQDQRMAITTEPAGDQEFNEMLGAPEEHSVETAREEPETDAVEPMAAAIANDPDLRRGRNEDRILRALSYGPASTARIAELIGQREDSTQRALMRLYNNAAVKHDGGTWEI